MKNKQVILEQGTKKWLDWRKNGIGSSEAAILAGTMPQHWETLTTLWKRKMGISIPNPPTEAMLRGIELEPQAREAYIQETGLYVEPKCFQLISYPWYRVSLDGISEDNETIIEIKNHNEETFLKFRETRIIPPYYYTQMQYQLFGSGAKRCDYYPYHPNHGGLRITIYPNEAFQKELLRRGKTFMKYVKKGIRIMPGALGANMKVPVQ